MRCCPLPKLNLNQGGNTHAQGDRSQPRATGKAPAIGLSWYCHWVDLVLPTSPLDVTVGNDAPWAPSPGLKLHGRDIVCFKILFLYINLYIEYKENSNSTFVFLIYVKLLK